MRPGSAIRISLVACALTLADAPARASLPDLLGYGARSSAMGATGAASAEDYEAVHANPAGLSFGTRRRLTVGYVLARYQLRLDGTPREVDGTNGLTIGAQLPLPLGGVMKDRLALGLGFYLPFGVVNRAYAPYPDQPQLVLLDNRTQTVSIMVAGAVRLPRNVALGVGVLALATLQGEISLYAEPSGRVISSSEQQLTTNLTAIAGIRTDAGRHVKLGAVLRGESFSRQNVRLRPDLRNAIPFDLPVITVAGISQYDPLQVAGEIAVFPGAGITIAAQLGWHRWSAFPGLVEPATPGAPPLVPPGFRDTVSPRAGFEWKREFPRIDLALRAGYQYSMSGAPDAAPERAALDVDRHVVSVGFDLSLRHRYVPLHLTGFFQWHQTAANARISGGFGAGGITLGLDFGGGQ